MRDPFQWSISLGRWHGLTVRLHVFFVVFAVAAAYVFWPVSLSEMSMRAEQPLAAAGNMIGLVAAAVAALFASVLVHELLHWRVARMARVEPGTIVLGPLGGLTDWPTTASPRWELAIWAAGPCANLVLALGLMSVMRFCYPALSIQTLVNPLEPAHVEQQASYVLAIAIWINCLLVLLNILPGFPFDGHRLLRAVLQLALPRLDERRIAECHFWITVGMSMLIAGAALVLWKNGTESDTISRTWIALFLLAIVLLASARREVLAQCMPPAGSSLRDVGPIVAAPTRGNRTRRPTASAEPEWYPNEEAIEFEDESGPPGLDDEPIPNTLIESESEEAWEEQRVDAILSRLHSLGMESLTPDDRALLQRASARYRSRLGRRI